MIDYIRALKAIAPDIVLTYTIKPNVWGGLAAQFEKIPYIANVTGLGMALERNTAWKTLSVPLYRVALRKASHVNFENNSDADFFERHRIALGRHSVFPGSGVNLQKFKYSAYPDEDHQFKLLFLGRLQRAKGVQELLEAIGEVSVKRQNLQLTLLGPMIEDFRNELSSLEELGTVIYIDNVEDVRPYLARAHAIVLPSHHEGMSNVLLEASAVGRPVIASNIPGCKETFSEGISGISHEPRNVTSLKDAIEHMMDLSHEERRKMGLKGRHKMETSFDRLRVTQNHVRQIESTNAHELSTKRQLKRKGKPLLGM